MKTTLLLILTALCYGQAFAKKTSTREVKPFELSEIILNKEIWSTSVSDFETKYKQHGFVYMSAAKKDLRSEGRGFTVFGKEAGETVIRSEAGKINSISISLYNRGDDGAIGLSTLNTRRDHAFDQLSNKTNVRPRDISKGGTVKLDRQLWMWANSAILLEKSISKDGKNAEFLRLRLKPKNATKNKIANRSSLDDNVIKDRESGDVYIQGVPMVDQGKKGYCAVASAARVYQYYGLDIDQHELAQIAGTGPGSGTTLGEMVAALKKVTRHVHSKVLVVYEYPKGLSDKMPNAKSSMQDYDRIIRNYNSGLKEFARDVKNYNRIAKKQGKKQFPDDFDKGVVNRDTLSKQCDKDIYRSVMTKKSSYNRFLSKIYSYIDEGVPVGWCLQLGMFKEENLPQAYGGHMRLITGYNKKTGELIYTDSWGAGHGKKRMPAADAFCMTSALVALPPTR